MPPFVIGKRTIKHPDHPFIIAEAGINHNGKLDLAIEMVDCAKEANCDCIKFQTFHAPDFIADPTMKYTYISQGKSVTESMMEMFSRCEFSELEWKRISKYCKDRGIIFLSTPQNRKDLALLLPLGIEAIKIGSDDFVNTRQISDFQKCGLPLLLSCGMADEIDIDNSLKAPNFFLGHPVALLLCTSEYPTPPLDVNLAKLITLRKKYHNLTLGFSDHTIGNEAAVGAAALGCCIFEKHFTLDHNLPGPDHWFSASPSELKSWCHSIHTVLEMYGKKKLQPTEQEKLGKKMFQRVIVAAIDIQQGTIISEDMLEMKRVSINGGLPSKCISNLAGKIASRFFKKGDMLCL